MAWVLKILDQEMKSVGYLARADFEAHAEDKTYPTGVFEYTSQACHALKFFDVRQAWDFINIRPKCCPTRPDGKPNKPLTALNIDIVEVPTVVWTNGQGVERSYQ